MSFHVHIAGFALNMKRNSFLLGACICKIPEIVGEVFFDYPREKIPDYRICYLQNGVKEPTVTLTLRSEQPVKSVDLVKFRLESLFFHALGHKPNIEFVTSARGAVSNVKP